MTHATILMKSNAMLLQSHDIAILVLRIGRATGLGQYPEDKCKELYEAILDAYDLVKYRTTGDRTNG